MQLSYMQVPMNDVNTMKYVRSITKIKEEMKGGGDIQVGFSGITKARSWP